MRPRCLIPVLFVLLVLVSAPRATACGWGPDGDQVSVRLLNPFWLSDPNLRLFSFSYDYLAGENDYWNPYTPDNEWHPPIAPSLQNQMVASGYWMNIALWAKYLQTPDTTGLYALIYTATPEDWAAWPNGPLATMPLARRIAAQQPKAWEYLRLSKELEKVMLWRTDPWHTHHNSGYHYTNGLGVMGDVISADEEDAEAQTRMAPRFLALASAAPDTELRLRAQLQWLKCLFYFEQGRVLAVADSLLGRLPGAPQQAAWAAHPVLLAWARHYQAQACYAAGQTARGALLDAQVFWAAPDKRRRVYQTLPRDAFQEAIALAPDAASRANMLAVAAIKTPGFSLPLVQQLYAADAQHPALAALLIREVNKAEDWVHTPQLNGANYYFGSLWDTDTETDSEPITDYRAHYEARARRAKAQIAGYTGPLQAFMATVAAQATGQLRAVAALSQAHLAFVNRNDGLAIGILAGLESDADLATRTQARALRLLAQVGAHSRPADVEMLPRVLEILAAADSLGEEEAFPFRGRFALMLSRRMAQRGELAAGAFLLQWVDRLSVVGRSYGQPTYPYWQEFLDQYATADDVARLVALNQNPAATAWEQWLCQAVRSPWDSLKLRDLWATKLLRENRIDEAWQIMETLPDSLYAEDGWNLAPHTHRNPFAIEDFTPVAMDSSTVAQMHKKEVVRTLATLIRASQSPATPDRFRILVSVANLYYNIAPTGKLWNVTQYYWSSGWAGPRSNDTQTGAVLPIRSHSSEPLLAQARVYYERALAAAPAPPQRHLCQYLLGRLWDETQPRDLYYETPAQRTARRTANPHWNTLAAEADTATYRRLMVECGGWHYFLPSAPVAAR